MVGFWVFCQPFFVALKGFVKRVCKNEAQFRFMGHKMCIIKDEEVEVDQKGSIEGEGYYIYLTFTSYIYK